MSDIQQMQQPTPVSATLQLTIKLEAQQWNAVLAAVAEAPYKVAAPLIQAIGEQLQQQTQQSGQPSVNGLDTPPSTHHTIGNIR